MAGSTINFIKELTRQKRTKDEKFYKRMLYYFELQLPGEVKGRSDNFMFPLILPPESITMDEPFAVELTPTQQGGLYAEENGIIQRTIRIKGNTGFKPRALKTYGSFGGTPPGPSTALPVHMPPKTVSHSRKLLQTVVADISGQKHFQYLQDSVFRTYGDLKRDPSTAKDTKMFFHNPKDDEHWTVIPMRFTMEREAKKSTLYEYNIELTIVGPADKGDDLDFDDKSWLDNFNNAVYMASLGASLTSGCLNDLTALASDVGTQLSNVTVIIDNVTSILSATQDFIDGVNDLIDIPHAYVISTTELVDEAASINASGSNSDEYVLPRGVTYTTNVLRKMADGLEMIASNPSSFETSSTSLMSNIRDRQDLKRTVSKGDRDTVRSSDGPTSYVELEQLGTGLTPGEVISSDGDVLAGGNVRRYKNMRIVKVGQGDTLASLASQYMGDARLWQYIANANGLKPPYIDDQASSPIVSGSSDESVLGRTLGVGSDVLIPSNTVSPRDYPLLPVIGTQVSESTENQLLGIDAFLEVENGAIGDSRAILDIAIDAEGGSTDIKLAEGLDNIIQAIKLRLSTEYGTDTMYKKVGLKRIVGLNFKLADLANAEYRIREAIGADSRIASIRNLQFEQSDDALIVDLDAELRGFAESRPVKFAL